MPLENGFFSGTSSSTKACAVSASLLLASSVQSSTASFWYTTCRETHRPGKGTCIAKITGTLLSEDSSESTSDCTAAAQALCPTGQIPGICLGQAVLADGPGDPFYPNPTAWALNPPRGIDQKHLDPPHRDELVTPDRPSVVTWPLAATVATHRPTVGASLHLDIKGPHRGLFNPMNRSAYERFVFLYAIEDSLDLHPVPLSDWMVARHFHLLRIGAGCSTLNIPESLSFLPSVLYILPTNFPEEPKIMRMYSPLFGVDLS